MNAPDLTRPELDLRTLAVELATDRLGIERPFASCNACGYSLYLSDEPVRPVDCDNPLCTAAGQIERARA